MPAGVTHDIVNLGDYNPHKPSSKTLPDGLPACLSVILQVAFPDDVRIIVIDDIERWMYHKDGQGPMGIMKHA